MLSSPLLELAVHVARINKLPWLGLAFAMRRHVLIRQWHLPCFIVDANLEGLTWLYMHAP